MDPSSAGLDALVVLGCRVGAGLPSPALERRLRRARSTLTEQAIPLLVLSGGKLWDGISEAEAMASWWQQPHEAASAPGRGPELLLELESQTTRQNAACSGRLLRQRGIRHIGLVTCDFHMARAAYYFRRQDLVVTPFAAPSEQVWKRRLVLFTREWIAGVLSRFEGDRE